MHVDDDYVDTDSSCCSYESTSEVDYSDLLTMPFPVAAETAYLGYRHAKRRWRKFAHPRRNPFGKGRGKGMFRRKSHYKGGKGHHSAMFSDDPFQWEFNTQQVYWKGKGKGKGKGNFHDNSSTSYYGRKNPLDKAGKRMLCSICNSDEHFRARCPKAPHAQKTFSSFEESWPTSGPSFTSPSAEAVLTSSSSTTAPVASGSSASPKRRIYFADALPALQDTPSEHQSVIYFADGSVDVLEPPSSRTAYYDASHAFPWWHVKSSELQSLSLIHISEPTRPY